MPAAILTGNPKNTFQFGQAKLQLDEHRQHANDKAQRFFHDQKMRMELERVAKAQKELKERRASNPLSVIAKKQKQFQEVMTSIGKSAEENRKMLRKYKIPKACIDFYDVVFKELANIAIQTLQRRLAVTATVQ